MPELSDIFAERFPTVDNVIVVADDSGDINQSQTNAVFSEKWQKYSQEEIRDQEKLFAFQKSWYLDLYGFPNEGEFQHYIKGRRVVLDAGCGLGYKAKWFADLSPKTLVVGMDYSDAVFVAAKTYQDTPNLVFAKGDIANTHIKEGALDYVSCDQVIHHTEDPEKTMAELVRILGPGGELAVYVYARKALPRELLDDYFRTRTKDVSSEDMWAMSEQLTELGKKLSDLNIEVDVPDIPLLDIKGGKMDLQRFIYWNFLKCFWNETLGRETSVSTNYDWYAPSNARRYSLEEFLAMTERCQLIASHLHTEEACHSGRFRSNPDHEYNSR